MSNEWAVLWPEQEVQPGSGAVNGERDAYQLVACVDFFLGNIFGECRVVNSRLINRAVFVIKEFHDSLAFICICSCRFNVNELSFPRQSYGFNAAVSLRSKQNLLSILEGDFGTTHFVGLAAIVIFRV